MFNHIENRQNEIRNNILNSFSDTDNLEKGGKPAQIGEKRIFSGREYVKTATGWKFHGKGTGVKAKEHVEGAAKKEGKEEINHELSRGQSVIYEGQKDKIIAIHPDGKVLLESGKTVHKAQIQLEKEKDKKSGLKLHNGDKVRSEADKKKVKDHAQYDSTKHELEVSSSYGDSKYNDPKIAFSAYFHQAEQFPKGGTTMVQMKDGSYVVTVRRRASIFEKQGSGKVLSFEEIHKLEEEDKPIPKEVSAKIQANMKARLDQRSEEYKNQSLK